MNNRPTSWQLTLGCLVASVALAGCSSGATPQAPSAASGDSSATASASASVASSVASPGPSTPSAAPTVDPRGARACDWLTPQQVTDTLTRNAPVVNLGTKRQGDEPQSCWLRAVTPGSPDSVVLDMYSFERAEDAASLAHDPEGSGNSFMLNGDPTCATATTVGVPAWYCVRDNAGGREWKVVAVDRTTVKVITVTHAPITEGDMQDSLVALYQKVVYPAPRP